MNKVRVKPKEDLPMSNGASLERDYSDGATALVVITRAARIAGDKTLERAARRELVEEYGIGLTFRREQTPNAGRAAP
jgi:hypothetical protein